MQKFTDFTGREVKVGDYIFYSTTGRHAESRICKITRFTPKSVFAEIIKHNRSGDYTYGREVIVKNDYVKINYYSETH